MGDIMTLMESGVKLGGGPVIGNNWKNRIHEIAMDLTHKFGGKPSESSVHVVCLCLFQVQNYVRAIMQQDPGFGGGIRLEQAACHEKFLLKLSEFCHAGNKMIMQKQIAEARARRPSMGKPYMPSAGPGAKFVHANDINSNPTTHSKSSDSAMPTIESTTADKHIGSEAARLLVLLSESIIQKNQNEISLMQRKEKEHEFDMSVKKIDVLEKKLSELKESDPLFAAYQDKLRELIKDL